MSERSLFWDNATGDGGPYQEADLRRLLYGLGPTNKVANVGPIGAYLNSLRPTTPGNNQARIDTGAAVADGVFYENDAAVTLTIASPVVGTTGIRVVLRKGWSAQTVRVTEIRNTDGTAAIPAMTQTDGTTWDIPMCSFTITTAGVIASFTDEREFVNPASIQVILDGGGVVLTTGIKSDLQVPRNLHPIGWTLLADQSGSLVVDVWRDTYANYPPTVADTITGADKPTLASVIKNRNLNISPSPNWPTLLSAGETLRLNIDSVTTVQRALLVIHCAG